MKLLIFFLITIPSVFASPLDRVSCSRVVKEEAKRWKARGEWVKHSLGESDFYYASATDRVGHWVLVKPTSKGTGISKISPEGRTEVVFNTPNCRKESTNFAQPKPLADHVSDQDLQQFVDTNKRGIIFIWSTFHNQSRKALEEIQKISQKHNLPLFVVLDPEVPQNEYPKYKEELGEKLTRRVDALEFKMRQVETFPTLLLVKDGRILTRMVEGYKEGAVYEKEVMQLLK